MSSVDVSALLVDTAEAPVCIDVKGLSTDDISGSPVGSAKSLVRNFVKEMSSIDLSGDLIGSEDSEFCIRSSGLRALPWNGAKAVCSWSLGTLDRSLRIFQHLQTNAAIPSRAEPPAAIPTIAAIGRCNLLAVERWVGEASVFWLVGLEVEEFEEFEAEVGPELCSDVLAASKCESEWDVDIAEDIVGEGNGWVEIGTKTDDMDWGVLVLDTSIL
jgi:hypothetical protein